ncbi:hypothetical protein [uncultured Limimaricola sp.]|uniref:hypothetical protein n=1 Tax=uncultured Limimaricola sp. TaxID=2211667 RepID=UPI0030F55F87
MWYRGLGLLVLFAADPTLAQQGAHPTVLEGWVINANPCASASTELMGMKIGVDRLRSVSVEKASLVIEGDDMTASLVGSLACETSANALGSGFISAGIDARVAIDLTTCTVGETFIAVSDVVLEIDMPGSMSGMREFFEEQLPLLLEPALRTSIDNRAVMACRQLNSGH